MSLGRERWDERCPTIGLAAALVALAGWRAIVAGAWALDGLERWARGERTR